jgi:hypothetical protein
MNCVTEFLATWSRTRLLQFIPHDFETFISTNEIFLNIQYFLSQYFCDLEEIILKFSTSLEII